MSRLKRSEDVMNKLMDPKTDKEYIERVTEVEKQIEGLSLVEFQVLLKATSNVAKRFQELAMK